MKVTDSFGWLSLNYALFLVHLKPIILMSYKAGDNLLPLNIPPPDGIQSQVSCLTTRYFTSLANWHPQLFFLFSWLSSMVVNLYISLFEFLSTLLLYPSFPLADKAKDPQIFSEFSIDTTCCLFHSFKFSLVVGLLKTSSSSAKFVLVELNFIIQYY